MVPFLDEACGIVGPQEFDQRNFLRYRETCFLG